MKTSPLPSTISLALLAIVGCGGSPQAPDGGMPDGGPHDAGPADGGPHDAGPHDAGPHDAGPADSGPPVRTATTRALLATPTDNLLSDPFVTSDTSLGHFVMVLLPAVGTQYDTLQLDRSFVSQAPAGVAAPVAVLGALITVAPLAASSEVVAPFAGGTAPFDAQVWASAGDAKGDPVAFDSGGKGLTVTLLPNDLPAQAYPLTVTGAPVVFAGRSWVKLALPTPVSMPQGGWFSIAVGDVSASFQLQAPQVTPAAGALMGGPLPPPLTAPRGERARAALAAYGEITRRR